MIRNIPREHWREELDRFSQLHEGWLVSITTSGPDGQGRIEARDLPLQGVSQATPLPSDLAIEVGDQARHITHQVHNVTAIKIDRSDEEIAADRALIIDSGDQISTTVMFLDPKPVDGLGLSDDRRD
jgi:uncharacterized protein DUF5335